VRAEIDVGQRSLPTCTLNPVTALKSTESWSPVTSGAGWRVLRTLKIDPVTCSFLSDHEVGGTALLPTVVQLDLVAGATRALRRGDSALRLSRIRVEAPVRLPDLSPRALTLMGRPSRGDQGWDLVLQGDGGVVHLRTSVGRPGEVRGELEPPPVADMPGTADLVYPPLFHGPAFRVIGRFGRCDAGLVALPAHGRKPWDVPGQGGALPTGLLELVLQTCGVWELAETGRMMRPAHIDEVVVPAHSSSPTCQDVDDLAHVTPRSVDSEAPRIFDAVVRDRAGRVRLQVRGYQPVALGTAVFAEASRRITERIGPTTDEGALR
jgi:Polyketide synthase dehydratase